MPALPEPISATPPASRPRPSIRALTILALVAVVIYGLDQVAKYLITHHMTVDQVVSVLGNIVQFHLVKNPGAAFSLGSGTTWIFAIIATAVAVFIIAFAHRIYSVGWAVLFGLLLGGNLGNLTDRLFREPGFGVGHVVDFVQVIGFPAIFNVADSAIVASMGLFIILTIRGVRLDGKRAPAKVSDAVAENAQITEAS